MLASCATFDEGGRRPQVQQHPTTVASIDFYGTDLKFGCTVTNPYNREIHFLSYVWELDVEGHRVQRGQSRQLRKLAPRDTFTLEFPASARRAQLEKLLRTTALDSQVPYRFRAKINLGAGVKTWSFDLADEGKLSLLASPAFDIRSFRVEKMDESRANVAIEILVRNPNTFPTTFSDFSADLILAGQTIAQGVEGPSQEVGATGTAVLPLKLDLNFARLGKVVYQALNQTETAYTLYGKTEMTTPWGAKKINYDQSGRVKIER